MRCEKRKHIQDIVREAEHDYKSHKSRDLYRNTHALGKDFKPNEKFLRNEDGTSKRRCEKNYARRGLEGIIE